MSLDPAEANEELVFEGHAADSDRRQAMVTAALPRHGGDRA